ncbi:MAG TPA: DUF6152 family protein [Bryobacteraceae bacterium]|jgi:hypothetical protein
MAHRGFRSLSVAVTLVASAYLAFAHHGSNISYQLDKTITVAGTVTEWDFANPHPQIYFDVKNEPGEAAHWAAELLPSPLMLKNMKAGWSRNTMKAGDQIVLTCNPSKVAGAKACLAKELKVNGQEWPLGPGAGPGGAKGKQ